MIDELFTRLAYLEKEREHGAFTFVTSFFSGREKSRQLSQTAKNRLHTKTKSQVFLAPSLCARLLYFRLRENFGAVHCSLALLCLSFLLSLCECVLVSISLHFTSPHHSTAQHNQINPSVRRKDILLKNLNFIRPLNTDQSNVLNKFSDFFSGQMNFHQESSFFVERISKNTTKVRRSISLINMGNRYYTCIGILSIERKFYCGRNSAAATTTTTMMIFCSSRMNEWEEAAYR